MKAFRYFITVAGVGALAAGISMVTPACTVCSGAQCFDDDGGPETGTNDTGTTDTGTGGDATKDSGDAGLGCQTVYDWGSSTCNDCMDNKCCVEMAPCWNLDNADADAGFDTCLDYVDCIDAVCGDAGLCEAGTAGCDPTHPKAALAQKNMQGCMDGKCKTECN